MWDLDGVDFAELAADIAAEVRVIRTLEAEIAAMDARIERLYVTADPAASSCRPPGLGGDPGCWHLGTHR